MISNIEMAYPVIFIILIAFSMSTLATRAIIFLTNHKQILQPVNKRSLHDIPTPVGGGWAVLLSSLVVWAVVQGTIEERSGVLIISAFGLALMSWIDDLKPQSALSRFGLQILAVCGALYFIPAEKYILSSDLPLALDRTISGICWLWFINLFNFMDGMDGLAASESIVIAVGVAIIGTYVGLSAHDLSLSIMITAAMAGFLLWNWHPAKIFLGDVGSIPTGFLLGWLLINLAVEGAVLAAFILPLYFLFDASLTITRRLLKGEKIWEAHRQHLYQKAALTGLSHSQVVLRILPSNLLLMYSAYVSLTDPVLGLVLAVFSIALVFLGLFILKEE